MAITISSYPNGFPTGVVIRGVPLQQAQPGEVFWVNNSTTIAKGAVGGSNGNPGTYQKPFSTIAYAMSRCTAGRGDIIMVMPNHAETISASTDFTASVAGVAVIGLGSGAARPTITVGTSTAATLNIAAANVSFYNMIFSADLAAVVALFTLTTAKGFTLENCLINSTGSGKYFINPIVTDATTNNADSFHVVNNKWIETSTGAAALVSAAGSNDRWTVTDNYVNLGVNTSSAAYIAQASGKAITNLNFLRNYTYRLNTSTATPLLISTNSSANTGIIAFNISQHATTTSEVMVPTSSGYGFFENRSSGVTGAQGYLVPAADS